MKLSEVIKDIEDGNKNIFKNGKNGEFTAKFIETDDGNNLAVDYFDCEAYYLPLDGLEEVKPHRQWSEKELMLFKLLPDWAKWIMRIAENIYCYEYEPNDSVPHRKMMCLNNFEFLKLENGEKHYIGDLKGE